MHFENLEQVLLFVADQPGFKGEILGDLLRVIAEGVFVDFSIGIYDPEVEVLQPASLGHKAINTLANLYKDRFDQLQEKQEKTSGPTDPKFLEYYAELEKLEGRRLILEVWLEYFLNEACINNRSKIKKDDMVVPAKSFQILRVPANSVIHEDLMKSFRQSSDVRMSGFPANLGSEH